MGAQVGFDAAVSGLVRIHGDINLISVSQSSNEFFARKEQSFGGGFSVAGYGFGVASRRSVRNFHSLSEGDWEGPDMNVTGPTPIPGVSGDLSASDGDMHLTFGVKALLGLELDLNLYELSRRVFGCNAPPSMD